MALGADKSRGNAPGLLVVLAGFALALLTGCAGSQLIPSRAAAREPLPLSAQEREHMRAGMRAFLESVEGITQGIAQSKMKLVAKSANRSGWSMMDATATAIALKLPPEFVAISIDTHQKFDDLASAASSGATKSKLLQDLAQILDNCTSCHAAYRLTPQ
jgi:cytochrome c556